MINVPCASSALNHPCILLCAVPISGSRVEDTNRSKTLSQSQEHTLGRGFVPQVPGKTGAPAPTDEDHGSVLPSGS